MTEESTVVVEWKIENFGCWCEAVHGSGIRSPSFFYNNLFDHVDLCIAGSSCSGDRHMSVRFCGVLVEFVGDFAFLRSDGSPIIRSPRPLSISQRDPEFCVVDLKFQELVDRLRREKNDEITLRLRIKKDLDIEQRMCSTLAMWEGCYRIDPKLIGSIESNQSKEISYFRYSSVKGHGICIKIARKLERILLAMKRYVTEGNPVLVECSLSMMTNANRLLRKEEVKHVFTSEETWTLSESLTVKEFDEKGVAILLRLRVINGEIVEKYNCNTKDRNVSVDPTGIKSGVTSNQTVTTDLSKDLKCLYQDQDFSDFRLKCDSVSFPVHKNILSARSPVFKTMLSCGMREAVSGEAVVYDLDPSTLSLFLSYLYSGALEDLECDRALKLYYAADKYQVLSLKGECAKFLCDKMSVECVCDVLSLADKHEDEGLTAGAYEFILNNYNDVLGSKNWENFSEDEPTLALKTLTYFAKKNYVTKSVNIP